jgi:hypothetical protein
MRVEYSAVIQHEELMFAATIDRNDSRALQ